MLSFSFATAPAARTARAACITPAVVAARARCIRSQEAEDEADAAFGGWHDSSYDLSRGLAVTEHSGFDDGASLALAVDLWIN